MTASDMVSVIEKVIVTHWAETIAAEGDGFWIKCRCGSIGEVESDAEDWEPANKWIAAHQARAVLTAISEAGAVEWGWEYRGLVGGEFDRRITRNWTADRALTREEAQSEVDNMNSRHPNIARLIHRNATAWTAVEG